MPGSVYCNHNFLIGGIYIKRLICVIFALLLFSLSSGCFFYQNKTAAQNNAAPKADSGNNADNESVSVTFPDNFIGLLEQFDYEALLKDNITENKDGHITLKMTRKQQMGFLDTIRNLVDNSINDILHDKLMSKYYSDIKVNNDCTGIQVLITGNDFDTLHETGLLPVEISCMIYQALNGNNKFGTNVTVTNSQTRQEIMKYYFSSDEL